MASNLRQRLFNWLLSIGLLILFCWLSITAYWFYGRFNPVFDYFEGDPVRSIWQVTEILMLYCLWVLPLALWHATNPVAYLIVKPPLVRALLSFRLLMCIATAGMSAHSLAASGILTQEKCATVPPPAENQAAFINCFYGPPDWLTWILLAMLLAVTLLAIGKTALAFSAYLKRTQ